MQERTQERVLRELRAAYRAGRLAAAFDSRASVDRERRRQDTLDEAIIRPRRAGDDGWHH